MAFPENVRTSEQRPGSWSSPCEIGPRSFTAKKRHSAAATVEFRQLAMQREELPSRERAKITALGDGACITFASTAEKALELRPKNGNNGRGLNSGRQI